MNSNDEIDLRTISRFFIAYFRKVIYSWKFLIIGIIAGAALGRLVSWFLGVKYTATATYAIQSTTSNTTLSSALSLASSFGLGTKTGSTFDANYFTELSKSKRIIKETFLQNASINGKNDLLANHFYYCSKFYKKWDDKESPLFQFSFKHNQLNELTALEDSVLTVYYNYLIDKNLTAVTAENNAFNRITLSTINREFSKEFTNALLRVMQAYYKKSVENINNFNFDIASKRVDSLAEAIRMADAKVARLKDNAANTIKQQGLIELNNALREQSLLNIQYSAAVNNYEASKTALIGTAPVIQLIDIPEFTGDVKYLDPFWSMVIGALLSLIAVLGIIFLFCLFSNQQS